MAESAFSQSDEMEREAQPQKSAAAFWPWLIVMAVLAVALAWRGMWRPSATEGEHRGRRDPAVGTKLPKFDLVPLTGNAQPVDASVLAGKVTLINFWGPWCTFCVVEFPHLVELEQHFRSQPDFQFFSVSANPDPTDRTGLAEETAEFLKRHRAEFPTYHDPDGKSQIALVRAANLTNFGYPTTLVLDRQGVIRGLWTGYHNGDERFVRLAIEETLRGTGASSADTRKPSPDPAVAAGVSK
jgi:cytochrome c biogenesis protein CcmG, thiol:disulfide interchange protein DsbE